MDPKTVQIPPHSLSFGLACIDSLIDPDQLSYAVDDNKPVVACIVGPDGVGKSILGLSAASTYAAGNAQSKTTRVIYVSTDLNITQATTTWNNFGLGQPKKRRKTLRETIEELLLPNSDIIKLHARDDKLDEHCNLQWLSPFPTEVNSKKQPNSPKSFAEIFERKKQNSAVVQFLDLAEFSAGDDWGLLNRIIGLLPCIQGDNPKKQSTETATPPHLLVIDAVEGLETMAGNLDAFGLKRSRRSRLAQLVRIARKANCSILFIIEQKSPDLKLDEVFISDLVLRLSVSERDGYLQKSIEIEKARSVGHIRGSHELQIRDGKGGVGDPSIPDDPVLIITDEKHLGYIQVWPSLHQKSKSKAHQYRIKSNQEPESIKKPSQAPEKKTNEANSNSIVERPSWFKSDLLNRWINHKDTGKDGDHQDRIVVSIGEAGTLKSRLAFDFLVQPFRNSEQAKYSGAILITSENNSSDDLRKAIGKPISENGKQVFNDKQILVRQIQPRFLSSSGFLFRIKFCIEQMKKNLRNLETGAKESPSNIRLVIDNWNTILETHPSIARDPQIMHRVFQLIREENILAHIVSTQPGSPSNSSRTNRANNIGQIEAIHLHTWPVDFFGDRRIAITSSVPGSADRRSAIYELIRDENNPEYGYRVSEDFDIYEDLESGKAKRVDLRVKLYGGFDAKLDFKDNSTEDYSGEVSALFGDLYPNSKNNRDVVSFESVDRYDSFKEYIQSMEFAKLDETLVFQVDEFWNSDNSSVSSNRANSNLANISDYLNKATKGFSSQIKNKDLFEDGIIPQGNCKIPLHKDFGLILADKDSWYKAQDLIIEGYEWTSVTTGNEKKRYPKVKIDSIDIDSIPLHEIQHALKKELIDSESDNESMTVKDVWNALCISGDELGGRGDGSAAKESKDMGNIKKFSPSWSIFLQACSVVARHCGKLPYDIDIRASESLNCQILETWFSAIVFGKIFERGLSKAHGASDVAISVLGFLEDGPDLAKLLKDYPDELRYSIEMINEHLPARLRKDGFSATPPDENAVAFRTWFASAVLSQRNGPSLAPLRLPGRFSTRGDWHVGVAKGSRSMLLAHSAIDKLTSESMNRRRLRDGVGLPTRKSESFDIVESALTVPTQGNSRRRLRYREIRNCLEPRPDLSDHSDNFSRSELWAIFRSKMPNYDRVSSELFSLFQELLRISSPRPMKLEPAKASEGIQKHYRPGPWGNQDSLHIPPQELLENFIKLATSSHP
ncbi:MAG: hypothetical protein ACK6AT_11045 [Planctomycetota bacterium]